MTRLAVAEATKKAMSVALWAALKARTDFEGDIYAIVAHLRSEGDDATLESLLEADYQACLELTSAEDEERRSLES